MDPETRYATELVGEQTVRTARATRMVNAMSSDPTVREYPMLQRVSDAPVMTQAGQGAQASESIYYPQIVDRWENPIARLSVPATERYGLLWGTDHAASHNNSGIYWRTGPTPFDFTTHRGRLFRDDGGGQQCETPNVLWFPPGNPGDVSTNKTGTWRMYYQLGSVPGTAAAQVTLTAVADEIAGPWVRETVVFDRAFPGNYFPGAAVHSGYPYVFWAGGQLIATEIGGGRRFGYRQRRCPSGDGVTWQTIPQRMGRAGHMTKGMPGWNQQYIYNPGRIFERRGRWWQISLIGATAAAGLETPRYLVAAPMTPDLLGPAAPVVRIDPPLTWENAGGSYLGIDGLGFPCTTDDGRTAIPYRAGGKQGAFGVLEIV